MPLHPPPLRPLGPGAHLGVKEAEAALVEHYPRLVRLAYLTLPPSLGRHRRVLAAHTSVQRALHGRARPAPGPGTEGIPAPRSGGGTGDSTRTPAYAAVRLRVVRSALAYGHKPRWWPGRVPAPAALRPSMPVVRGLRLFPRAGGMDEFALDRALADVSAPVRAALGLRLLESLSGEAAQALLMRQPAWRIRATPCGPRLRWPGATTSGSGACWDRASSIPARFRPAPATCCAVGTGYGRGLPRWRCSSWRAVWPSRPARTPRTSRHEPPSGV